ncbi:MAG: peptidoglycan recognition protein family protein [Planctomycetota bacterium]|jgi:hypothetical protein|nr:peptidoglycan recognition protein family protein [Planctomycetota bacterium]
MKDGDNSAMTRRDFLMWAAAAAAMAALPGCDSAGAAYAPAPKTVRPVTAYAFTPASDPAPQYIYVQPQYVQPDPAYVQAPAPAPRPAPAVSAGGKVSAMSRNSWGATAATPVKMKAMNGVARITIHHEGSGKGNSDANPTQVAATLRLIQKQHRQRMGAGDIGYHFVIDRSGMIWQGRDWKYQGAHTSGANSHNIGVMLLGNFEFQQPTQAQLASLKRLTLSLMRKYGLSCKDIYGHADFCNTQCPGKHLKPHVNAMKQGAL